METFQPILFIHVSVQCENRGGNCPYRPLTVSGYLLQYILRLLISVLFKCVAVLFEVVSCLLVTDT